MDGASGAINSEESRSMTTNGHVVGLPLTLGRKEERRGIQSKLRGKLYSKE